LEEFYIQTKYVTGQCELACDCKGAVDAVTAILNGATWSSYDILILIMTISCDIGVSSDTWHNGYPTVIPAFTVRDEWMVVT